MKDTTTLRNDDKVNQIVPIMQEPVMLFRSKVEYGVKPKFRCMDLGKSVKFAL